MSPFIRLEGNVIVHRDLIERAHFIAGTWHAGWLTLTMRDGAHISFSGDTALAIWRAIEGQSLPSGRKVFGDFFNALIGNAKVANFLTFLTSQRERYKKRGRG